MNPYLHNIVLNKNTPEGENVVAEYTAQQHYLFGNLTPVLAQIWREVFAIEPDAANTVSSHIAQRNRNDLSFLSNLVSDPSAVFFLHEEAGHFAHFIAQLNMAFCNEQPTSPPVLNRWEVINAKISFGTTKQICISRLNQIFDSGAEPHVIHWLAARACAKHSTYDLYNTHIPNLPQPMQEDIHWQHLLHSTRNFTIFDAPHPVPICAEKILQRMQHDPYCAQMEWFARGGEKPIRVSPQKFKFLDWFSTTFPTIPPTSPASAVVRGVDNALDGSRPETWSALVQRIKLLQATDGMGGAQIKRKI